MKDQEMHYIDHLSELRRRIIVTLVFFLLAVVGSFLFVSDIYEWLTRDLEQQLILLGPSEVLWVYFMIAGVIAIAATIPIAAMQIWLFVKPALSLEEQRVTMGFIPFLFLLFIAGIAFGYFIVFPIMLNFLMGLSQGYFESFYTAEKYFGFMINVTLPFGFLFEMPLIVMFLTRLGILNPMRLAKARKLSYFILVVVSVMITPPDFVSDFLVIIPLLLLYEISVSISRFVYRKRLKLKMELNHKEDPIVE